MPEMMQHDAGQDYRIVGKLREIALSTNDHPADDADLNRAAELGHVEHDGGSWSLTDQGQTALDALGHTEPAEPGIKEVIHGQG